MRLIKPDKKYYASYLEAIQKDEDYSPNTERIFSSEIDYFDKCHDYDLGINLPPTWVPSTQLWAIENDTFIGKVGIRQQLSDFLIGYGGHVGYEVRYSYRGKGYGTTLLALTLDYIKNRFPYIKKVLITCNDDNAASYRVMEKNGAVMGEKVWSDAKGDRTLIRKYWINLSSHVIETSRLILKETTMKDFDDLYAILSDHETMKYYPHIYDQKDVKRWLNWCIESYNQYGFGLWSVIDKESGKYIGDCGLSMQLIDGEQLPEIGYHLNKKYWHKGYASEAARAVKKYIFANYHFPALYTYTNALNTPSIKVATNNGMVFLKKYKDKDGQMTSVYVLTRQDFDRQNNEEINN